MRVVVIGLILSLAAGCANDGVTKSGHHEVVHNGHGATKLSSSDRTALEHDTEFRDVNRVANLPSSIVRLCAGGYTATLADRGEKWETADVVTNSQLPRKRPIWADTNDDYYVVHYERGGEGHSFHVLVARLEKSGVATAVWRGVADERFHDYKEFLQQLDGPEIDDTLDYAY